MDSATPAKNCLAYVRLRPYCTSAGGCVATSNIQLTAVVREIFEELPVSRESLCCSGKRWPMRCKRQCPANCIDAAKPSKN